MRAMLLVVLEFRVFDALILGVARQRVALLLGDFVLGHHGVFASVRLRVLGFQERLGVGRRLDVLGLGFLHAHVFVIALLGLASVLGGLVVGVGLRDRGFVFVLPVPLGRARGIDAAHGKEAQHPGANRFRYRQSSQHGPV